MKKILMICVFGLMIYLSACSQLSKSKTAGAIGFTIKGRIDGAGGPLILSAGDRFKNITPASDGSFEVSDTIADNSIMLYTLMSMDGFTMFKGGGMAGIHYRFFAQNGDRISITGRNDEFRWLNVSGNEANKQLMKLNTLLKPDDMANQKIWDQVSAARKEKPAIQAKVDSLQNLTDHNVLKMNQIRAGFIKQHPDWLASGLALADMAQSVNLDEVNSMYQSLSANVQQSSATQNVLYLLGQRKAEEATSSGLPAPDFVKKDKEGKTIRLSDYKGKYVLLDFWGSWCGPCRASHPHLKEVAEKYRKDGLVVIGIAEERSSNKSAWLKAIEEDGMTWTQIMNDEEKEKSDVVDIYGIKAFPTKILIDKEGKIVLRYEGTNTSARVISDDEKAQTNTETASEAQNSSSAASATASSSSAKASSSSSSTVSSANNSAVATQSENSAGPVKDNIPPTALDEKLKEIFRK